MSKPTCRKCASSEAVEYQSHHLGRSRDPEITLPVCEPCHNALTMADNYGRVWLDGAVRLDDLNALPNVRDFNPRVPRAAVGGLDLLAGFADAWGAHFAADIAVKSIRILGDVLRGLEPELDLGPIGYETKVAPRAADATGQGALVAAMRAIRTVFEQLWQSLGQPMSERERRFLMWVESCLETGEQAFRDWLEANRGRFGYGG